MEALLSPLISNSKIDLGDPPWMEATCPKNPITRSGEVGLNFGGSTFVGLLPTTPDRVMVILGHVAYIQDGSTWRLGAGVCTQFFSKIWVS